MSTAAVDYNSLAAQSGAVSSTSPAPSVPAPASTDGNVDYDALAAQSGALSPGGDVPGEQSNDLGLPVVVSKDGESFSDTMKRGAAYGKTVAPEQINKELATAPEKSAEVLGAAALPMAPEILWSGANALAPALTKGVVGVTAWMAAHPQAAKFIWETLKTATAATIGGTIGGKLAGQAARAAINSEPGK